MKRRGYVLVKERTSWRVLTKFMGNILLSDNVDIGFRKRKAEGSGNRKV